MSRALALLEFESVATGVLAVDRMLKRAPVDLLRCGTVHPGKYLVLVGGTVAATEEAHEEGTTLGRETTCLIDEVFLPDPHADMQPGLVGSRNEPEGDTLAVLEVSTASAMLRVVDAVLKRVPVQLSKLRLADDLGGKAVAFLDGELSDIQEAVAIANEQVTDTSGQMINASIMSRMDETLRKVLTESTTFGLCRNWRPSGAEQLED